MLRCLDMGRVARIVVPGLSHHVTQRGNRRAEVCRAPRGVAGCAPTPSYRPNFRRRGPSPIGRPGCVTTTMPTPSTAFANKRARAGLAAARRSSIGSNAPSGARCAPKPRAGKRCRLGTVKRLSTRTNLIGSLSLCSLPAHQPSHQRRAVPPGPRGRAHERVFRSSNWAGRPGVAASLRRRLNRD
jgi:hypothetical protein